MSDDAQGVDLNRIDAARQVELLESEQRARQLAERALERLSGLQRVTAGLSEAVTPAEVASVVMDQGIAALEGRTGRISLLRPDGETVEVLAHSGYTQIRNPMPLEAQTPTNEVIRTGRPLFLPTFADVAGRFPAVGAAVAPMIPGALASAPLIVEGRVVGAMTLTFEGDRDFQAADRELLSALATQCAQALERSRLYELSLMIQEDLRRSRDQLAAILGGIAEGVTVQDVDGHLVYANDVAAGLSGYSSADEFISTFPDVNQRFTLFDEAGEAFPFDSLPGRRLLRGELPAEVVVQFRNADTGEWRWSILDATPVRDVHGRLQLVVNIFRDITDRKRQADAADFLAAASTILSTTLELENSLQQVAELAVPRIADWCIIDLIARDNNLAQRVAIAQAYAEDAELAREFRGRIPGVNTTGGFVERVLRTGRGELIGDWSTVAEDMLPEDPGRRRLLEGMRPRSWIVVPLRARGQTFGSVTLATSRSGRRYNQFDFELAEDFATRAAFAIDNARLYREAHEQAEHQSVLNVALRETIEERDAAMTDLQKALRTRDEFLASASHDLKNPLASIKATAQLLERRLDHPETLDLERVRDGLERVDAIATRAAGLVEELLDLARMQMGRPLDLEREPSDLVKLAMQVVDEHQHTAERHALRLITDETELIGNWDGRRLGRVLSNLLDNAVKYSPDGGDVELSLQREGDWAILEVKDHGIGIPERDHDRVFERFQRASNVERRIGGTGIGLASARHIVDSHGGTIRVQSQEGAGTTFVVRLPLGSELPGQS
jgi:signal transduction histidine kinase